MNQYTLNKLYHVGRKIKIIYCSHTHCERCCGCIGVVTKIEKLLFDFNNHPILIYTEKFACYFTSNEIELL